MLLRCLSALLASVISFFCLFSPAAMAADTNWQILGHFYENDAVANALNDAEIGVGASVSLNVQKTQFTVLGDTNSVIYPGYKWKSIGIGDSPESELATVSNDTGAVSSTATVNANGNWTLWGYVPD